MKKGDLVKYNSFLGKDVVGVIARFDEDGDPSIIDIKTGLEDLVWRSKVETLSESR